MKEERFIVVPKVSIRPSKVVFYQQFVPKYKSEKNVSISPEQRKDAFNILHNICDPVEKVFNAHNFEISKKASARIKEKISWLYELSKSKTITKKIDKPMYSYKMCFLTLTLPFVQQHETSEITKVCLHQFLTECKIKFGMNNYVWRLEFQKNGNAHYHIATDSYIDYVSCKLIWNRCLQKLGYISWYSDKMSKLSFEDYRKLYSDNGKVSFEKLRERYGRGCATRWDSPNTVDVIAVANAKNIAFYISKYITKKSDTAMNPIVSEREPKTSNLRLWYCSKSLSALDKIEIFLEEYDELVDKCLGGLNVAKSLVFDYCKVWYYNTKEQVSETKRDIWQLFRRYSKERNYIPAG